MMFTPEVKYCVRYLLEKGVDSINFTDVAKELKDDDARFELVKTGETCKKSFFEELAAALRELWPPGEKDGKYPWRDSVSNLTRRLEYLWSIRFPTVKDGTYTIEQCLQVARKYLAQFEDNAKYMQTLKYFIMKQNASKFADMLEDEQAMDSEWNAILNDVSEMEGELI